MTVKRKKRVLAIDDEPSMTEWLKILLEHEGYEVRTALIGARGEELFRTWRPDAVVTDMMLPDVDGLEVYRRLRAVPATANVPVIVLTARTAASTREEAKQLGVAEYMNKPFDPDHLIETMRKHAKQ